VTTLEFVLAAMLLLAPSRDHAALGGVIAARVDAERPLFVDDADKRRTASLMVAIAFRESSLANGAIGDQGRSFCAYQINQGSGGTRALTYDIPLCVAAGFAMLRASMRACPSFPVAVYAVGPAGCSSQAGQRISRDRMWLAARLVRDVKPPAAGDRRE